MQLTSRHDIRRILSIERNAGEKTVLIRANKTQVCSMYGIEMSKQRVVLVCYYEDTVPFDTQYSSADAVAPLLSVGTAPLNDSVLIDFTLIN